MEWWREVNRIENARKPSIYLLFAGKDQVPAQSRSVALQVRHHHMMGGYGWMDGWMNVALEEEINQDRAFTMQYSHTVPVHYLAKA